jgi:hypothetical protein
MIFSFLICNIEYLLQIDILNITDRVRYHRQIEIIDIILNGTFAAGFYYNIFSEIVYWCIIFFLSLFNLSPSIIFKILIFICVTIALYTLIIKKGVPKLWSIIAILTPLVLVNYVMTLKQGVAISVFLIGYYYSSGWKSIFLLSITPLIHFSFLIILPILWLSKTKFILKLPNILNVIFMLAFSYIVGASILKITTLLGLNNLAIQYSEFVEVRFGFGIIFWSGILLLFFMEGHRFTNKNIFPILVIVFYLGSIFIFSPFSRIIQNISLITFIEGFELTGERLIGIKIMQVLFVLYLFVYFQITGRLGQMTLP